MDRIELPDVDDTGNRTQDRTIDASARRIGDVEEGRLRCVEEWGGRREHFVDHPGIERIAPRPRRLEQRSIARQPSHGCIDPQQADRILDPPQLGQISTAEGSRDERVRRSAEQGRPGEKADRTSSPRSFPRAGARDRWSRRRDAATCSVARRRPRSDAAARRSPPGVL